METMETDRRRLETLRRAADKRAQRSYEDARRRMDALEKSLTLIIRSLEPGKYTVDERRAEEYRLGVNIGRKLIDRT